MSKPQWLPLQQQPVIFEQVKFDIRGGFPFSLFEHHRTMKPHVSGPMIISHAANLASAGHDSSLCLSWPCVPSIVSVSSPPFAFLRQSHGLLLDVLGYFGHTTACLTP